MSDLSNLIRRESSYADASRAPIRIAEVTSYNEDSHSVVLKYMPEGNSSGWVPLGSAHIGNGFGIAIGPNIGDQFVVAHIEGDHNTPVIISRIYSDKQKPPKVKAGEMLLMHGTKGSMLFDKDGGITVTHKDGGSFKFDKDGHVSVDTKGKNITVDSGAGSQSFKGKGINIKGPVTVDGSVTASETIAGAGGVTSGGRGVLTA
ncbi:phage baseplate assembly protein V [Methylobacterium haplocladii]|uniref:Gp5/Type VI secretion system Vgr protein OB-fold domain-containing protein n=1 Tax=Methylobacterium haplocladii TaxID=1176176 RepID=A0A512ISE8_9HYPH|nr:phage baseplate assembly protein V [Methylobacterium haplocladii]GEP00627.1 hypothetical protein MHA02_30140 [Methylobacterium haplocladii]GJD85542.1 hypothetical protein HPGCJGGD_3431 [Methylobacterium haplocladii]GLS57775.1 hypothetical protein GCM10007887_04310 [Methylobacterium haplocladii]